MYLEQIEKLVVLQKVDGEILVLEEELGSMPRELADLEARNAELLERKAVLDDKLDILNTQRKRLDLEIEDNTSRIKKSKNKLMMAGNTREYHAMMREMDNMEKTTRNREEEKVALAEELERQTALLDELQKEQAELTAQLEEYQGNLKKRSAAARKRLAELQKEREEACVVVPAPVLKRYEFIRERISNPVIVPVTAGVCSGCFIQIPPQAFNDLQKGETILSCPNCQRLIYWCEHFHACDSPLAAAAIRTPVAMDDDEDEAGPDDERDEEPRYADDHDGPDDERDDDDR
jgi:hypothetical protein